MTKLFALPAIALCLYGLVFYVSAKSNWIPSKSNNVSHDVAELPAVPTPKVVQAETAAPEREAATPERESISAALAAAAGDCLAASTPSRSSATPRT